MEITTNLLNSTGPSKGEEVKSRVNSPWLKQLPFRQLRSNSLSLLLIVFFLGTTFTFIATSSLEVAQKGKMALNGPVSSESILALTQAIDHPIEGQLQLNDKPFIGSGVIWNNYSFIDYPYQPITLKLVVDTNDNVHIFYSNYQYGRSLFHKIIYPNGTEGARELLYHKDSGQEIKCDAAADQFGKVHLVFSWGSSVSSQKTFYQFWENGVWSERERVDYGVDQYGGDIPAHDPVIAVDKYGAPHVLWSGLVYSQYLGIEYRPIYYQRRIDTNWWTNVLFVSYAPPGGYSMIISDDNVIHIAATQRLGEIYQAYYRVFYMDMDLYGSSFGLEEEIWYEEASTTVVSVPRPEIVYTNNTIYFFFIAINEENKGLYYCTKTGQHFNTPELLTEQATFFGKTQIAAKAIPNGNLAVTWPSYMNMGGSWRGAITEITFDQDSGNWSEPGFVTNNFTTAYDPSLSYDSTNRLHLVWWDYHPITGKAIYYAQGLFDFDLDGLTNDEETNSYFTDPFNPDTDGDLMKDGDEVAVGMDPLNPDEDSDLILDGWEYKYGFSSYNATDAQIDFDTDGLTNYYEFTNNTHPRNNDTDFDFLTDGQEIINYQTDPLNNDTDNDLLSDGQEILIYSTNATNPDTEGDEMPDGWEIKEGLDPFVNDSYLDPDLDNLWNIQEYAYSTNPWSNDTDNDLLSDYDEIFVQFTDPRNNDTDSDHLSDYYEITIDPLDDRYLLNNTFQTNPLQQDTDNDNLDDFMEINTTGTNPTLNDTDGDLMTDGYEYFYQLDPFNASDANQDKDSDGLTNYQEFLLKSNPTSIDSDGDSLFDYEEYQLGTNLTNTDTDGDGISDFIEYYYTHSDPTNADVDNDGLNDYYELYVFGSNPINNDSDHDSLLDGDEVFIYGSSPTNIDTDNDKLIDPLEVAFNSNPAVRDTDGDGMEDMFEYTYGLLPRTDDSKKDPDGDKLLNIDEFWYGANPLVTDSDGDLLDDYTEVKIYFSSPIRVDTDFDSISDYDEIMLYNTSAIDFDTDDDLLSDGEEILTYGTNPLSIDSDGDGYSDFAEINANTDPLNPRDNPHQRIIITMAITFSAITGGLLIYYLFPYLFLKLYPKEELTWIAAGEQIRRNKNKQLTTTQKKTFETKEDK